MNIAGLTVSKYEYYPPFSDPRYQKITSANDRIKKTRKNIENLQKQSADHWEIKSLKEKINRVQEAQLAHVMYPQIKANRKVNTKTLPYSLLKELEALEKAEADLLSEVIHYTKVKEIGKGAFSTICHVKNEKNSTESAFKRSMKKSDDEDIVYEAELLRILNEEENERGIYYVARLIAFLELEDKRPALLLSLYVSDFSFLIKQKGGLSEKETLSYLESILKILQFLKEEGVIHLDIKPENFFITDQGELRLGDFGFALLKRHCPPMFNYGTPVYKSPEFIISKEFCDFASDMWAAAITACHAYLGGVKIFNDKNKAQIYRLHQIRFRKQYPEFLRNRAIEKGKGERICPIDQLNSCPSFKDVMKEAFSKKLPSDWKSFELLLKMLKEMFEFDYRKRITPEDALELLSQNNG